MCVWVCFSTTMHECMLSFLVKRRVVLVNYWNSLMFVCPILINLPKNSVVIEKLIFFPPTCSFKQICLSKWHIDYLCRAKKASNTVLSVYYYLFRLPSHKINWYIFENLNKKLGAIFIFLLLKKKKETAWNLTWST